MKIANVFKIPLASFIMSGLSKAQSQSILLSVSGRPGLLPTFSTDKCSFNWYHPFSSYKLISANEINV